MILRGSGITVRYPGVDALALSRVDVGLSPGELVAVVGPNGSGKTTLLRALVGSARLESGRVEVDGRELGSWTSRSLAQVIAVVTQREDILFPLSVRETVELGRYAHLGPLADPGPSDAAAVNQAMERADVLGLAHRRTDTLSGGEWQRVRVARALAQNPRVLLLDEPTAALDIRHEMEVFELVRKLAGQGMGALLVTHHLNLAARYADRLLLLDHGRVVAEGAPADVLTAEVVSPVFEWRVAVTSWCDGAPQVVPLKPGE
jgi:iron complex transport system ATP-binding protein